MHGCQSLHYLISGGCNPHRSPRKWYTIGFLPTPFHSNCPTNRRTQHIVGQVDSRFWCNPWWLLLQRNRTNNSHRLVCHHVLCSCDLGPSTHHKHPTALLDFISLTQPSDARNNSCRNSHAINSWVWFFKHALIYWLNRLGASTETFHWLETPHSHALPFNAQFSVLFSSLYLRAYLHY